MGNFKLAARRVFRAGLLNFLRNSFVSLSAVLIMIVTLLVVSLSLFEKHNVDLAIQDIRDKVDVNIYFVPDATEQYVFDIKEVLETLPEVEQVEFVSAEQALAEFIERNKDNQIILNSVDEVGENPLGPVLNILATEPRHYSTISQFVRDNYVDNTELSQINRINEADRGPILDNLQNFIDSTQNSRAVVIIVLLIVSFVITFNTIRLAIYISREEIHVMKLVGASNSYIRNPFVITGIIYGIISAIVVMIILYPLSLYLSSDSAQFSVGLFLTSGDAFEYYKSNFFGLLGILLGTGILVGAISSSLAVRRYLSKGK